MPNNYIEKARKAGEGAALSRIADALEKIANYLDKLPKDKRGRPVILIKTEL